MYQLMASEVQPLYKPGVVEVDVERIRALRRERVLTIRELAEKAGVSKTTTSNLEQGQADAYPSTIRKLAAALEVEPAEMGCVI